MTDDRTPVRSCSTGCRPSAFDAAVAYLDDVLRECQLSWSVHAQGSGAADPTLVAVAARAWCPTSRSCADVFRAADITTDGRWLRIRGGLAAASQPSTLAHLQMQLVQLRLLGRRGGLLLAQRSRDHPAAGLDLGRARRSAPRPPGPGLPSGHERRRDQPTSTQGGPVTAANVLFITVDQWRGDCLSARRPPGGADAEPRPPGRDAASASPTTGRSPRRAGRAGRRSTPGLYVMNHRSVNNGTPLDDRFTNIAREARAVGYDPTLFGYTDTSVDPRTVDRPRRPAPARLRGRAARASRPGPCSPGTNMAPWARWLDGHGHRRPRRPGTTSSSRIAGYPGADDHGPTLGARRGSRPSTPRPRSSTERVIEWLDQRPTARPGSPTSPTSARTRRTARPRATTTATTPTTARPFRRLARPGRGAGHAPASTRPAPSIAGCPSTRARPASSAPPTGGTWPRSTTSSAACSTTSTTSGQTDDTLIVLTSDHGDQMGDHWLVEKLGWWDESYHVPLIVVDPRPEADATRGTVVDAFTESVDVMPTLCTWMGAEVPVQVDGRALQPFLHGDGAPDDWRTEAHWQWDFRDPVDHVRRGRLRPHHGAVHARRGPDRRPQVRALRQRRQLLFDLADDPDQVGRPVAATPTRRRRGGRRPGPAPVVAACATTTAPSPATGSPPSTASWSGATPAADRRPSAARTEEPGIWAVRPLKAEAVPVDAKEMADFTRPDVAHLLRRAGFGGSTAPRSTRSMAQPSWAAVVDRVLDTTANPADTIPAAVDNLERPVLRGVGRRRPVLDGPDGHQPDAHRREDDALLARATWRRRPTACCPAWCSARSRPTGPSAWATSTTLFQAMAMDPAMLLYLDNASNVKAAPERELRP